MALDTIDFTVIGALVLMAVLYFAKDYVFPSDDGTNAGFTANIGGKSRDLVETITKNSKNCVILYGSQTGTAEEYSHKLAKELSSRFSLKTLVGDLSDFDYDNLNEVSDSVLVFFVLATYGEGEPTDDAVEFFDYLENEADDLSSLKFCVFGLGNSTYEFYNEIAKKAQKKLEELNATPFGLFGLGDDGVGSLDEDFLGWKDSLMESLKNELNFEEHEVSYQPSYELVDELTLTVDSEEVSLGEPNKSYLDSTKDLTKGPFDHSHPYLAPITASRELFSSNDKNCIHAEFDLSDTNLRYTTGDHLAIWPSNSDYNISNFVKAFGLGGKLDDVFSLKPLDSTVSIPFPTPTTIGSVLRHYLEISGPVSRQFFTSIAGFAPSDAVKAYAIKLGGDKALFASEVSAHKLNIADAVLKISNGVAWEKVPFEFIIETLGHLQQRYYSISSSSLSEKTCIHVTAVVETEKVESRYVTGVVTNLLRHIQLEQNNKTEKPAVTYDLNGPRDKFLKYRLPVHVRRSTFKLPTNPKTPVILIGPGTGIAPFRGFVRERVAIKKSSDAELGKTLVFFGCRNSNEDFLYKEEWPQYSKVLGDTFEMHTAFSREDPTKKVYVQHKLTENGAKIAALLKEGAFIYVCGDASKMARDVQHSLVEILAKDRDITEEKAAELVRSYKTQNRYQEDVW
ncbi:NADPH-cytochrome P450 reductase [Yamadazyma tenuis]|uniref:NADPH--cytochrome P450 reductase n=1 Tax=Candida tenuis (strain ATCC 10573 / BCRC 21748 / CBS 615 / JCM 9827 / NBRC 10315 / NRRL Y-1498 / VKM Y-70) TaxID=590646 RepID=G3BB66_CANTC|nr:uncharacterized protein CANTEDRAFT_114967 [Yamadazyma tenuis ATCC 10573]XP_006688717.1 uncharacterized protein CANTEDRAFT_114967 [Yamadazyma tenuis ATCC 10573]EGV62546.1 hypothetical protein CANTEDRAFT_114967 [Yamadazyma tenuis ATCC 10573]EGV62547.1 hypothetical protein CANTEDRAFT_114967 [Yamadazyma tenuis ATCC 10573]WEJ92716.1 NADPH-cytochrome P450 reductase [Yamadazyma tenuis]